jgi:histidinol-phosphate aminotransferase
MVSAQSPRFRPVLDRFAPYKAGKTPPSGPDGRSFKLSSNESPFGPLPSVAKVITEAAASINRYPDDSSSALIEAIAARWAVPSSQVTVGCGGVGLIQQLLETVGEPGAEVVYAWRSFECYPTLSDLAGVTSVRVPLRDATHDLAALAAAVTSRTRLVFVCNPNNPTSTVVQRGELEEFLGHVPADCLVVLDEAYAEYVRDPAVPRGISLVPGRPNLAVLRSFSKAYGLAGLRVGYLIAHEAVTSAVRKTKLRWPRWKPRPS